MPVGSRWQKVADGSAAGGTAVENPDRGQAKITQALASPSSYVEAPFHAAAGVPYRLWIRMRAAGDSYTNDSIFVQFSGSLTSSGSAATRIGSTSALGVVLEDGSAAGEHGWGWADAGYGTLAAPIYFNQDGEQTIRIQQREDGVRIDQIVISADQVLLGRSGKRDVRFHGRAACRRGCDRCDGEPCLSGRGHVPGDADDSLGLIGCDRYDDRGDQVRQPRDRRGWSGPRRAGRLARTTGVGDRVMFAGLSHNVSPFYGLADLFVLPSLSEGLPNALLEAMACGLPIVATRVGGVPEIATDGVTALVGPAENPASGA